MDNQENQNVMFNSTNVTESDQMGITALISSDVKSVEEYAQAAQESVCDDLQEVQPLTLDEGMVETEEDEDVPSMEATVVEEISSCADVVVAEPQKDASALIEAEVSRRVAEALKKHQDQEREARQFQAQLEDFVRDRPTLFDFLSRIKNESQPFADFAGKNVVVSLLSNKSASPVKIQSGDAANSSGITLEVVVQAIRSCIAQYNASHKDRILSIGNKVIAETLNTTPLALLAILNDGIQRGVIFAEGNKRGRKYYVDKKVLGQ